MKSLLTWQEVRTLMSQKDANGLPVVFSVVFVTADQARQTGGEVIRFSRACLSRRGDDQRHATRRAPARSASSSLRKPKKPSWSYLVRNLDSGAIRKVNLHLILYLNDYPVR